MRKAGLPVDLILSKLAEDTASSPLHARKASEVLLGSLETEIAQTPYDVVFEEDRVKLKYYQPKKRPAGHLEKGHWRVSHRIHCPPFCWSMPAIPACLGF